MTEEAHRWLRHFFLPDDNMSPLMPQRRKSKLKESNEQCGDVTENKGALWKTCMKARMSMKKRRLAPQPGNVVQKKRGYAAVLDACST
jgi:hypothetical protein